MHELRDAMLGRNGALVAAAHEVYRLQMTRRPELEETMTGIGREREVAAGRAIAG